MNRRERDRTKQRKLAQALKLAAGYNPTWLDVDHGGGVWMRHFPPWTGTDKDRVVFRARTNS